VPQAHSSTGDRPQRNHWVGLLTRLVDRRRGAPPRTESRSESAAAPDGSIPPASTPTKNIADSEVLNEVSQIVTRRSPPGRAATGPKAQPLPTGRFRLAARLREPPDFFILYANIFILYVNRQRVPPFNPVPLAAPDVSIPPGCEGLREPADPPDFAWPWPRSPLACPGRSAHEGDATMLQQRARLRSRESLPRTARSRLDKGKGPRGWNPRTNRKSFEVLSLGYLNLSAVSTPALPRRPCPA
jgi:hypothetical protein